MCIYFGEFCLHKENYLSLALKHSNLGALHFRFVSWVLSSVFTAKRGLWIFFLRSFVCYDNSAATAAEPPLSHLQGMSTLFFCPCDR